MEPGQRHKERLTEAEIRKRVDSVMDDARSYPDFAHLFNALMLANSNMETKAFAQWYTEATGMHMGDVAVGNIRRGLVTPTYQFIADILDHNLLSFDRERIRPATQDHPAGNHRIALFAAAGLM
jgi:hypothetical protein